MRERVLAFGRVVLLAVVILAAPLAIEAQRPAPSVEAQRIPSPFPAAPATSQPSADAISQPSARASEATSVPEVPSASARARAAAPAPMAAPAPPAPASAMAGAVSKPPTPLAKTLAGSAQADQASETRIKDRPTLSVADWIALIRRLRAACPTRD